MACLLALAEVIQKNLHKIPTNQGVRLLFQPAEEGPGGAQPMIKAGCLESVDEVYGFHNVPNFDEGDIRVLSGPFFAAYIEVTITITAEPENNTLKPYSQKDPIACANAIFMALHIIKSYNVEDSFVFTICHFKAGSAPDV